MLLSFGTYVSGTFFKKAAQMFVRNGWGPLSKMAAVVSQCVDAAVRTAGRYPLTCWAAAVGKAPVLPRGAGAASGGRGAPRRGRRTPALGAPLGLTTRGRAGHPAQREPRRPPSLARGSVCTAVSGPEAACSAGSRHPANRPCVNEPRQLSATPQAH